MVQTSVTPVERQTLDDGVNHFDPTLTASAQKRLNIRYDDFFETRVVRVVLGRCVITVLPMASHGAKVLHIDNKQTGVTAAEGTFSS